jgi:T5SS/PEP-CTERM-associated repeat protein
LWSPSGPPGPDDVATIDITGVTVTTPGAFTIAATVSGSVLLANTSELSAGGRVIVGEAGNGTLTIQSGATLVDSSGTLGDIIGGSLGAAGTVTVDGAHSTWSDPGRLFVGVAGNGRLTVTNGASVSAVGLGSTSDLAVDAGVTAGANGIISVSGLGSSLVSDGRIGIGAFGTGELDVLNGATVQDISATFEALSNVFAAGDFGGQGLIVVSGSGSRLDAGAGRISLAAVVAGSSGSLSTNGTLVVSAGGTVTGGSVAASNSVGLILGFQGSLTSITSITNTGTVTLDGAGSLLSVDGLAFIGGSGAGVLVMSNSASANLGGTSGTLDGGVRFADVGGSTGQGTVESGASLLSRGQLSVGFGGSGTVLVQNGGQLSSDLSSSDLSAGQGGIVLAVDSGSAGALTVTGAGSKISTNGAITVGRIGGGTLNVDNGASAIASNALNISRNGANATRGTGAVSIDGSSSVLSAGSLNAGGDASGTLSASAGDISVTNGGKLSVVGDAVLGGGSTLSIDAVSGIEIGGTAAAPTGVVTIDADATLSGDGDIIGPTSVSGFVSATGGLLHFASDVTGAGQMEVVASSVLELAGSANSASALFDSSGTLRLDHGAGFTGTVDVGPVGGTVDLADNASATAQIIGGDLHIAGNGGTYDIPLAGSFSGVAVTTAPDSGSGTNVIIACFMEGTKISTSDGETRVEDLQVGDYLATVSGGRRMRTIWLGHRHLDCRRHPRPTDVWPVRVRAGAFSDCLPMRDLLLSPDHAVFVDDALIPVRHLINGSTIVQEQVAEVTYYHVELATHGVVLAEGLPCESYLDTGNRAAFEDGGMSNRKESLLKVM